MQHLRQSAGGRRVVLVEAYPHVFTGAQRATLLLACGLRDAGWQPHVATTAVGPYVDAARSAGIPVTVLDVPSQLRVYGGGTTGVRAVSAAAALPLFWTRLARFFRSNADLVHAADHRGLLLAGPAARLARRPVVWHVHAVNPGRAVNRVCASLANRTIVPSRAVLDRMPGIERRRPATIVPYALATAALTPVERSPEPSPLLVTAGRVHPDKGIDVLLRAVAQLRSRGIEVRAVVAGAVQQGVEEHQEDLVRLRKELELDDDVELAGHVDDVRELLAAASIYVQPSRERTELQPIAVLEALAAGVPVVATGVGGVPEMLDGGRFGVVVPPDDPAAFADGIAEVLHDPSAADLRARAASAWVRQECVAARMVDRVLEVYASL